MLKFGRAGSTFTTVVAGAAVLAVFGTGTAVAGGLITSARIKNNTVKSVDVRNNNLTGVDVADGSLSGADVADGSLSNQDVGVYFVTVWPDGSVVASSGGVTVARPGQGQYRVDFNVPVASCAFSATVGHPNYAVELHGEADVTAQSQTTDSVLVFTRWAGDAAAQDLPFQLIGVC
jgi:hypothetical protein